MKNNPPIRLLALDIDNTLIPYGSTISQTNFNALQRAKDTGVVVTLATGRPFGSSKQHAKQLGITAPMINFGGAMLVDPFTGSPIWSEVLDADILHEVLLEAKSMQVYAQIYDGDDVVSDTENAYGTAYCATSGLRYVIDSDYLNKRWENVAKILVIVDDADGERVHAAFLKKFGDRVNVLRSLDGFVEINRIGTDKGTALAALAEMLHIPQEQTCAIGDSLLDVPMIEWAGYGVSVANAPESVKQTATHICPACGEDGVAWFIDHYILEGKS